MRRVVLSTTERARLEYLQKYSNNSVERNQNLCLLLSNKGNSMSRVARLMDIHWITVNRLISAWEKSGEKIVSSVLRQSERQDVKKKLAPIGNQIPRLMDKHERTLDFVRQDIKTRFGIDTCKLTLQNFLKDTGLYLGTNTKIVER